MLSALRPPRWPRRVSITTCAPWASPSAKIQTDCSVNATIEGKTYCFGARGTPRASFMKDPKGNLAKATRTSRG
jgi:hypothetical protein